MTSLFVTGAGVDVCLHATSLRELATQTKERYIPANRPKTSEIVMEILLVSHVLH